MIKLFRNIRKKLISENRSIIRNTNYFKYAIGEIFLVVVGILIALQINNWNEKNKARTFETTMLSEIRNQLKADLKWFDYLVNDRLAETDSFNTVLLGLFLKNQPVPDSILKNIAIINQGYLFQYNAGPYEALKSSGLDKISNDSIRNSLANVYDFYLPWTQSALEIANESWSLQRELYQSLMERKAIYFDNEIKIIWSPKNNQIWLDKNYGPMLINTNTYVSIARFRITNVMDNMLICLNLIDKELGTASP